MPSKAKKQYTIRSVPLSVDRLLRKKAAERGQSLNTLVLEALAKEVGEAGAALNHDLDPFSGSWIEDRRVDRALQEQRRVDPKDWE